ncbi:MAG: hypothetical protein ACYDHM_07545 [Acidiferrobacterales bacterium]
MKKRQPFLVQAYRQEKPNQTKSVSKSTDKQGYAFWHAFCSSGNISSQAKAWPRALSLPAKLKGAEFYETS